MHLSASHFTDLILSLRTASTLTPGHLVDLTGFYEQGFPARSRQRTGRRDCLA